MAKTTLKKKVIEKPAVDTVETADAKITAAPKEPPVSVSEMLKSSVEQEPANAVPDAAETSVDEEDLADGMGFDSTESLKQSILEEYEDLNDYLTKYTNKADDKFIKDWALVTGNLKGEIKVPQPILDIWKREVEEFRRINNILPLNVGMR